MNAEVETFNERSGVIRDVALVDPVSGSQETGDIFWRDGVFTGLSPTGRTAPKAWVTPAGIDCHVHLVFDAEPGALERVARLGREEARSRVSHHLSVARRKGIAMVRDLGDVHGIAGSVDDDDPTRTRVLAAGYGVTSVDGHGKTISREVTSPPEVEPLLRSHRENGSTWVKTFVTGGLVGPGSNSFQPTLPEGVLARVVAVARDYGLRVAAHVHGAEGVEEALQAGVDCVEHGSGMTRDQGERMAAAGIPLVPTLLPVARILAATDPEAEYMEVLRELRAMQEIAVESALHAGTMILVGTDAGTPHNPIGGLGAEMEELALLGVPRWEVARAATSAAARFLGADALGTLAPGSHASFTVVGRNPIEDFRVLDDPDLVVMGGGVVDAQGGR